MQSVASNSTRSFPQDVVVDIMLFNSLMRACVTLRRSSSGSSSSSSGGSSGGSSSSSSSSTSSGVSFRDRFGFWA
jgi:hypothetical protein